MSDKYALVAANSIDAAVACSVLLDAVPVHSVYFVAPERPEHALDEAAAAARRFLLSGLPFISVGIPLVSPSLYRDGRSLLFDRTPQSSPTLDKPWSMANTSVSVSESAAEFFRRKRGAETLPAVDRAVSLMTDYVLWRNGAGEDMMLLAGSQVLYGCHDTVRFLKRDPLFYNSDPFLKEFVRKRILNIEHSLSEHKPMVSGDRSMLVYRGDWTHEYDRNYIIRRNIFQHDLVVLGKNEYVWLYSRGGFARAVASDTKLLRVEKGLENAVIAKLKKKNDMKEVLLSLLPAAFVRAVEKKDMEIRTENENIAWGVPDTP